MEEYSQPVGRDEGGTIERERERGRVGKRVDKEGGIK